MFLNVGAWTLLAGGVMSKFFESQVSDKVSCAGGYSIHVEWIMNGFLKINEWTHGLTVFRKRMVFIYSALNI